MKNVFFFIPLFLLFTVHASIHAQGDKATQAYTYLAEQLSISQPELSAKNFKIIDSHTSQQSGVTYIYFIQTHGGIEIYNAISNMALDRQGKVVHFHENFMVVPAETNQAKRLTPNQAVVRAAGHHGQKISERLDILSTSRGLSQKTMMADQRIAKSEIIAALEYIPMGKELKLVWSVVYEKSDDLVWWDTKVDAMNGQVLKQVSWTLECKHSDVTDNLSHEETCGHDHNPEIHKVILGESDHHTSRTNALASGDYRVIPMPYESPTHAGGATSIVSSPWSDNLNPLAHPFNWHLDGNTNYNYTRGNNVWAQEDLNGDNGTGASTNETDPQEYDYTPDFSQTPATYIDPAVTNLFYWNNIIHDVSYHYGFDEAAGNFQNDNNGQGGSAGDYVLADAQDGSDTNNAVFSSPPDGFNPRMQMYEWTQPSSSTVTVTSPYQDIYSAAAAGFGPATNFGGTVIDVIDTNGTTHAACNPDLPFQNNGALSGNIALIDRGGCNFTEKIINAENAGAIAVIMCNNVAGPPINMAGSAPFPTIPSVMISQNQCQTIRQNLPIEVSFNTIASNNRDSDYDNGVIIHEYGHGISTRLTGGASNSGCLSGEEQMGEGWSDYFGLVLTMKPDDTATQRRGIASYLRSQSPAGNGIRPFPYSTDTNTNPLTYADTDNPNISIPHGVGTVWCTMLWDMTWKLIDIYGIGTDIYDSDIANAGSIGNEGTFGGQNLALQLVMEGLKLQPCNPGFVDGRDAIIAADELLYDGIHQCVIWQAFANRGLGASAKQGSPSIVSDNIEAFDIREMSVTKSVNSSVVNNGGSVMYDLRVDAFCNQDNISLSDTFDPVFTITAVTCPDPATSSNINNNTVTINHPALDAGQEFICTVTAVVNTSTANPPSISFEDDVESGSSGWTSSILRGSGLSEWMIVNTDFNSASNAWYIANEANPASNPPTSNLDNKTMALISPLISLGSSPALSFYHRYVTETGWDGGYIEVSDDGGSSWQMVEAGDFIQTPYNGTLGASSNPDIAGKSAWTGNSGGFVHSILHLAAYKNKDVNIRFVYGQDNNTNVTGWWVDDIRILEDYYAVVENVACATSDTESTALCDAAKLCVNLSPNGCDESLVAAINNQTDVSCYNGADGAASGGAQGGTAPYSYAWSTGSNTASINNLSAGPYTLTVTDASSCTGTIQLIIQEPQAALTIQTVDIQAVSCFSGSDGALEISGAGGTTGYSYLWSTGASTDRIEVLTAGQYTVTVTDAQQCTISETLTISEPATALSVTATATQQVSCTGEDDGVASAAAAGGTGGYTYLWSTGSSGSSITDLAAGIYTVTVTDALLCEATATVTVTEPAAVLTVDASVTQNISCVGEDDGAITATPSGGTSDYTYLWSTGSTNASLLDLSAGSYAVTTTDANGCIATGQVSITEPANALSATAQEDKKESCSDSADGEATVSASGGSSGYIYLWPSGGTSATETQLSAGTYAVTVTDASACSTVASVTITHLTNPLIANATQSKAVSCLGGSDGIATATAIGGSPAYSYAWSNGATSRSISNITAGMYQVTITDANGCNGYSVVSIDPGVNEYTQQNGNRLTGSQSYTVDYEVDGAIESDQIIDSGAGGDVDYDSATCILLQPGFEVKQASVFHAFIDGCGGND